MATERRGIRGLNLATPAPDCHTELQIPDPSEQAAERHSASWRREDWRTPNAPDQKPDRLETEPAGERVGRGLVMTG